MNLWKVSLAACAVLVLGSYTAFGQSVFTLGFSGLDSFSGGAGDPFASDYNLTLQQENGTDNQDGQDDEGAQGWSVSLTADNASINSIDFDSSEAAALFAGGFKKSELTTKGTGDCAGLNGAVSAVVLSFTQAVTLGLNATKSIAIIGVGGTLPAGGGTATLRYVENCQGAGQPVQNNVTERGASVTPVKSNKEIRLSVQASCCNAQGNVGFSSSKISSATPYDGILDDGSGNCSAFNGTISADAAPGTTGTTHAYANISSNAAGEGVQGWSFSIALTGDAISFCDSGVTTDGTPGVDNNFAGGFKKTEVVDPAKNNNVRGAVSAVVLSFTQNKVLPPTGTETVLDLCVMSTDPLGNDPVGGGLAFFSGLRGAGQPVQNALTIGGNTADACNFQTAAVKILFSPGGGGTDNHFLRGNANNDLKVNIADPIWIINELFRSGPSSGCAEASNANGDDVIDAADAVFLIDYEFQSGSPPPAPFPACDTAPPEDCAESQAVCAG
jgi:hypothetical protein